MIFRASQESVALLRRVGVVGDIHCEDLVLERVLAYFSQLGVGPVLAVGDIVDGVGDADRVYSLLVAHGVLTVRGNHDRWILADRMREVRGAIAGSALRGDTREWLAQLPKTRSFQTPMGPMLLCHGLGDDDMAELRPDDDGYALESNFALQALLKSKEYSVVIGGHTHLPMVRTIGGVTIINAGSLERYSRQVCSLVDFERRRVEFFEVGQDRIFGAECFAI